MPSSERRIRLVGWDDSAPVPAPDNATVTTRWDEPVALVAVAACDMSVFEALYARGELLTPIADFTPAGLPRSDYRGVRVGASALAEALADTAGVRAELNALPDWPSGGEGDALTALALAATRQAALAATWWPHSPEMVHYPLLAGLPRQRPILEGLAEAGLVARRFFDRVHLCQYCGGARLVAREVCPSCGSAHLAELNLVHHYRCGHQAPKPNFEREDTHHLVCPKCHRTMRHYGVDYDVPGSVVVCQACGERASEPDAAFACADCSRVTPTAEAATRDWFHYSLTAQGERALAQGRLPKTDLAELIRGVPGEQAPRDLGILINYARRIHARYDRPFFVLVVQPAPSAEIPPAERRRAYSLIADVVRTTLRESDFVAALADQLVILLPETPPSDAERVRARLHNQLAESMGTYGRVDIRTVDSQGLDVLEDQLRHG